MQLMLSVDLPKLQPAITHKDKMLLIGSCFTENMSERLAAHKFNTLSNPNGILFNPLSVADSLNSYLDGKQYEDSDLFSLNELWNSWDHHTRFSHIDKEKALEGINNSQTAASSFIKEADWIIITLGSAFQYYLSKEEKPVANNHRAPAQWFEKRLLETEVIVDALKQTLGKLFFNNPKVNVIFTISPVRHIRDGVIDNNRSKARLIEAVHAICDRYKSVHYFAAYEIIIDILRDYRYFDVDFVHPNYMATSFVWEQFVHHCMSAEAQQSMKEVHDISIAKSHRSRFPETEAHSKFLKTYAEKTKSLQEKYPYLSFDEELAYFTSTEI